ncbi:hypothetical protein ACHAXT_005702 [Thalassiosira profunda]
MASSSVDGPSQPIRSVLVDDHGAFVGPHSVKEDAKVVKIDMHPASSYVQWLQQRLDAVDAEILLQSTVEESEDMVQRHDNSRREGGSLRRLPDEPPRISQSQQYQSHEEIQYERELIQQQLDEAIASLRGTGAAYASVTQFSPTAVPENEGGGHRHLKQSSETLDIANERIREYNDRYRHYSRHEWAVREKREDDGVNPKEDDSDRELQSNGENTDPDSPLTGTGWQLAEIASRNATELSPVPSDHPITLSFANGRIAGTAGCNNYHASVAFSADSSFHVGFVGATRMMCHGEGVMDREGQYISFLMGREFFFERVDSPSEELILLESDVRARGHAVPGEIVARYVPLVDVSEGASGEQRAMEAETRDGGRTLQQTKKKGGMFNSYQTSPLHQGYGTHYATIWVGTPAQRKSVIIDTGSHFTAFPCKGCKNCGEEHHTDKYFDPEASTTFRALTCDECHAAQCEKGQCIFSQTYTEGSSWHAYEAVDKVFVGGRPLSTALNPINNSFKTDFLFGCQMKETGLFVTQLADGIMGMSAHPSTLPRAMWEQGKLEHNMFSMCFRRELHVSKQGIVAGLLTLGGIDSRKDFAPMVYAKNVATSGWFTVFVKNVYIREGGGQSAKADGPHQTVEKVNADIYQMNSGKGVIIDSGTTDTYLHESIAKPFERVWAQVTGGKKYSNAPVKMEERDLLLLPTVLVQMAAYSNVRRGVDQQFEKFPGLAGEIDPESPQDVILAIPATHYMEYSPSKGTYTPRIYFTESRGGVIGANAMQGHNVLFDWEHKRVGFAESSCEYEQEQLTVTDEGVMSVDCKLGAPSLSVSCSDSADLSRCERGAAPNTALQGLEIWTRVVQAPGTPKGKTCEEFAEAQNVENGGGPMEVQCDGKGVCREVRQCVISCANAIAHGTTASKNAGLSPIGSCGDITWSACDYTCSQTKVEAVLMNDGKCHEEKSLEVTRPCHVQACGRSDPCRVPFVVHAIMKIRGAVASHWTKHSEEVFRESFAAAANERRKESDSLFEAGDVIVLNSSPWRASDDTVFGTSSLEGEDEELGMQIVVETSIFNENAELPPVKGKIIPLSTCHERDLQPLANVALSIHKKLAEKTFIDAMVERMKSDVSLGEKQMSPFYFMFEDRKLARESQVVTSWTIKTDVGVGSSRLDAFKRGDLPMDFLLLTTLVVITAYTVWSLRLCSTKGNKTVQWDPAQSGKQSSRQRRRARYAQVPTNSGDDDDTVNAVADREYLDNSERSDITTISEQGESLASIGSLSAYFAKTLARS